ncbi:MAG: phosphatase PAP2 family protein [Cryobacterium sp.]|nr:phosphatase PAP2 family protein [Oligoflexia bacterium]
MRYRADSGVVFFSLILTFLFTLNFSAHAGYPVGDRLRTPPPPNPSSNSEYRDYRILHDWQKRRTHAECDSADLQALFSPESTFGPDTHLMNPREFDIVKPFFAQLLDTASDAVTPFKLKYQRMRPYDADRTITPCIHIPGGSTSYPSGHAAGGRLIAHVFADLFPARGRAFYNQGQKIGANRVLGGVHYPSDVKSGNDIGDQVYDVLQANPQFRSDFMQVKKQLGWTRRGSE